MQRIVPLKLFSSVYVKWIRWRYPFYRTNIKNGLGIVQGEPAENKKLFKIVIKPQDLMDLKR